MGRIITDLMDEKLLRFIIVGVINTRGNAEIRNSAFNCPYSPLITMGKLARAHRCVRFDIQNNVAVCAGYFLYAFNVNTTVGSVISGNIVSISKDLINRGNGKVGGSEGTREDLFCKAVVHVLHNAVDGACQLAFFIQIVKQAEMTAVLIVFQ